MARITYSALVDNIRGSIGGTTFQTNAYGYTVKAKPNMVSPKTPDQIISQNIVSAVSRAWRDLSSAQRAAYDTFASTYPQYAKHNPTSQLSGYAVWLKYNCIRSLFGYALLSTITGTPPTGDTITYILDSTAGDLDFYVTLSNNNDDWHIMWSFSRPFTASQNFIGTRPRRLEQGSNFDEQFDITSVYTAKFGSIPTAGDRVALSSQWIAQDCPYVIAPVQEILTVVTGT